MTRKELKEFIESSGFEYQSKIKGRKSHQRHCKNHAHGWFSLIVDYNENTISLTYHGRFPNERMEPIFSYFYMHGLTKEQLQYILDIFIN
jgi:hypothetical protein